MTEREREALMRLTMCAREECGMCKYKDTCGFDFQYELATKNMNILAEALRKTENSSEKPNNSTISKMEHVDELRLTAKCLNCANGGSYKCSKCDGEMYFKTEPQGYCNECEWYGDKQVCGRCRSRNLYAPKTEPTISKMEQVDKDINVRSKDEPQTEDADCDKCIWSVCNYNKAFAFEDEPQADCDGCQHYADKHTADACYECKRSYTDGYEPQTERSE